MEPLVKRRMIGYFLASFLGFSFLVMPYGTGIGVPLFILIQFGFLYMLILSKKALGMFVPIGILSLNYFLSGNDIWYSANFFVILALAGVMSLTATGRFTPQAESGQYFADIIEQVFTPVRYVKKPFLWAFRRHHQRAALLKRILLALVITVPVFLLVVGLLSSADAVFEGYFVDFLKRVLHFIDEKLVLSLITGFIMALYLFGYAYRFFVKHEEKEKKDKIRKKGDLLILNVLLGAVLLAYTAFVAIQFRYLFARGALPYGLTYTEYARKGFFELLFLSGLNILLILVAVRFRGEGRWGRVAKGLCYYLCFVSLVLLASSFYRMGLYSGSDGLTRLRLLVFGFLIFEAIGLVITFFYIARPRFPITLVYLSLGLVYYLLLNIVPIDALVARNQIDRYFQGDTSGIAYAMTLSSDAAPQIQRLLSVEDEEAKGMAEAYFTWHQEHMDHMDYGWREWNLSREWVRRNG